MDRRLSMLLIGLVFGGGIGFTIAAGNGVTFDGHDHATGHNGDGHDHSAVKSIDLPASDAAPTLAVQVFKDPASGCNLQIHIRCSFHGRLRIWPQIWVLSISVFT